VSARADNRRPASQKWCGVGAAGSGCVRCVCRYRLLATVAAEPTSTGLSLSTGTVTFGHEQSEHLTATVKPAFGGTATGKVTVKTGSTSICTITLVTGKGSCTLSASKLRPGQYTLTATYTATSLYAASTSPKKALTVTK
jgi:Bacterial Ig-like domain (group 3)